MTAPNIQQGFPQLDTPFVNPDRLLALPWYHLLVELWQKQGGGSSTSAGAVIIQHNGANQGLYDAVTGQFLGNIAISAPVGGAAVPVVPGPSPYTYVAAQQGTLIVASAQVELSRDSGLTWYLTSVAGGAIPVLNADQVRLTWYGGVTPTVTFFPTS